MKLTAGHMLPPEERVFPWRELAAGVGITLALHLAGVGIFVIRARHAASEMPESARTALIVETELLRWGEELPDPTAMPTIPNPKPAPEREPVEEQLPPPDQETQTAPTEVVNLQAPSEAAADAQPTELRAAVEDRKPQTPVAQYRGPTNPNRPTNDLAIEGYQDGYRGGTSLSPSAQRNLLARIQEQLQRAFRPPRSLSDEALQRLKIRVHVRIAADGQILGWDILESSGDRQFDTAATMTLNRFRNGTDRLDMASIRDASLRELIEAEGLPIVMVGQ